MLENLQSPPSPPAPRASEPLECDAPTRRLWTADRLDVRLRQARIGQAQLCGLAAALGALHAEPAPRATGGDAPDFAGRVRAAGTALRSLAPENAAIEGLVSDLLAALARCAPALAARCDATRARRLHGALRPAGIHIDAAGRAEIDPAAPASLPGGDPAEEMAGLLVQLAADGHPEFARRLLAAYADASGDYALYPVIDVMVGLAALEAARARLEAAGGADRRRASEAAEGMLGAPRLLAPALLPARALVFAGIMASGKSTLSERLSTRLGVPRISGDALRARLARQAVQAGAIPLEGLEDSATDDVYAAVLQAARDVLSSGRTVVVDATFPTRALRAQLRALVGSVGAELRFFECRVAEGVVQRRLRARARAQHRDEDEWLTLLDRFLEVWEPIDELPDAEHLLVDTTRDPRACLESVEQMLRVRSHAPHRARPSPRVGSHTRA